MGLFLCFNLSLEFLKFCFDQVVILLVQRIKLAQHIIVLPQNPVIVVDDVHNVSKPVLIFLAIIKVKQSNYLKHLIRLTNGLAELLRIDVALDLIYLLLDR